jgi:hypothetical protein
VAADHGLTLREFRALARGTGVAQKASASRHIAPTDQLDGGAPLYRRP